MAWVLLDDNFPHHPKAVTVGRDAAWLYVCGLCYCRKFHTSGFIPRAALADLGAGSKPRNLVVKLVSVGLWDAVADGCDGFQIHDYEGFYADEVDKAQKDSAQEERAGIRRIRQDAGRKGGEAKRKQTLGFASSTGGSGVGGSLDLSLEEKKRDADFGTFWQAYPRKDGRQAALKAWLKAAPDIDMQRTIAADIERRSRSSQWLKDGGQFIPMASTYINGRRWEDGFVERPRLSERTVNVIKGFEDVTEIA